MKITLGKPVTIGSTTYSEIDVREEITVKDMIAAADAANDVERLFMTLASLADVPRAVIDAQPATWAVKIEDQLEDTLMGKPMEDAPTTGETLSPSLPTSSTGVPATS
ncbi:phage tail assembly protein [Acuticoccus sp. M5D2P5]|uniref:phage tail assembly protein n=1 Tax=Acuticoccus kalidii TaxID=2910977 RepID=UPI001F249746|nr:phage tail assembly protein [Acuticoccus kalidii]MCF3934997.1 phage tail assembly protein [Acuticoccus kalidii]